MLKLICGPSGAGKTSLLKELIQKDIEKGIRTYLLVPEQQAYISERDFPATLPKNAGLFFEIVNFSGLCDDVFRKYGGGTKVSVNAGIRSVLMWETLRKTASMLTQYGRNVGSDATLPSKMLCAIDELRVNGIDGARLEEAATSLEQGSSLQKKLFDLALIDAVFHQTVEECFGEDPSDKLTRLANALKEHRYFEDCKVYFDSFSGFTAQEFSVIGEIIKQADLVTVTICSDSFRSELPHFSVAKETAKRLEKLAQQADAEIEKITLEIPDLKKPLPLEIIERDLWRFDAKKDPRIEGTVDQIDQSVELFTASNLYEESEFTAWKILELVQSGMRFGDIAVIARDTELYRGVLDTAFERHNIPFFLSERTDLSSKPLARLILAALRAVSMHYRRQDIITLVKTGLLDVSVKEASLFEEYCDTWHLNGSRFCDEIWNMNPDGLTIERSARADEILVAANRTRKVLMDPLLALEARLRSSNRLADRCRAIYEYLHDLNVSTVLALRAERELAVGQKRQAGETLRLYDLITEILATLAELLPDSELSTEEFISVLSLLFAQSDMGSVPEAHDCVVIGSASMLRVENVKTSFLLGLCEGEFPRAVTDDGLLTEADKCALEELGILFDSHTDSRSGEELLYVYRAMTKAKERLYLSTVAHQADGSLRTPSLAFSRVKFLLGQKPTEVDTESIKRLMDSASTLQEEKRLLSPYPDGTSLYLSQTKIHTFALCPYRYYSTYRLKLREKKDATPALADDGTFLHYIYEHFLKRSLGEDGLLHLPKDEMIESITDEIIEDYLSEIYPIPKQQIDCRLLHLFNRLRKHAMRVLYEIIGQLRAGEFVPKHFEAEIGQGGIPSVKLELKNGSRVILGGKIDRVDLYEKDGHLYVSVVDYKAGSHEAFSADNVRSGLDIQLVLYLYALLASDDRIKAASAQYLFAKTEKGATTLHRTGFVLNDTEILNAFDGTEDKRYTKELMRQSDEEICALQEDMKATVTEIATRILAGEAQKCPSKDACSFCPVRDHCDVAYHE